jgi:hypothetical protein
MKPEEVGSLHLKRIPDPSLPLLAGMAEVLDDANDTPSKSDKRGRKRKWTVYLDVVLLREVKAHEPPKKGVRTKWRRT